MSSFVSRYSSFIFIAGVVAFGVFLVWNIANSSFVSRIFNRTETIMVTGTGGASNSSITRELDLVTLLPFDAIRSIEDPIHVSKERADELYSSDELVLGVEIDGDARAYSIPLLSRHEVVNDVVGGRPIAVTW